jgi:hypothetical protein
MRPGSAGKPDNLLSLAFRKTALPDRRFWQRAIRRRNARRDRRNDRLCVNAIVNAIDIGPKSFFDQRRYGQSAPCRNPHNLGAMRHGQTAAKDKMITA